MENTQVTISNGTTEPKKQPILDDLKVSLVLDVLGSVKEWKTILDSLVEHLKVDNYNQILDAVKNNGVALDRDQGISIIKNTLTMIRKDWLNCSVIYDSEPYIESETDCNEVRVTLYGNDERYFNEDDIFNEMQEDGHIDKVLLGEYTKEEENRQGGE
jgi:hypothetical protein